MSKAQVSAGTIRDALKQRFPVPEYAVLFEVTDASGARQTRSADAVVMSCWPSRGLELHGYEIKVYRSDWLKERTQPKKAETIAGYCDRWWLLTGPGVVHDISEIPPAWGWMEYVPAHTDLIGERKAARLVTRREPTKTDAKPADRLFLAALLRNASRAGDGVIEEARREAKASVEADIDARVEERLKGRGDRASRIVAEVEAFEAETGIRITDAESYACFSSGDGKSIGRMVRALRDAGMAEAWGGMASLFLALSRFKDQLEQNAEALGIPIDHLKPKKRKAA